MDVAVVPVPERGCGRNGAARGSGAGDGRRSATTVRGGVLRGQKKVIAGDAEGAKENFAKAIATKANLMAAFRGARFETGDVKVGG